MDKLVIAEFPAKHERVADLDAALRAALKDTRAFDGCKSLRTFFNPDTDTFVLIEYWESFEHYDRYLQWRIETGLADTLEDLLEGGMAAFRVQKLQTTDI